MERRLKERLVGAAVLAILAVIFIPMVLDDTEHPPTAITTTNIPPRPEGEFTSRIVPIPAGGTAREQGSRQTTPAAAPPPGPAQTQTATESGMPAVEAPATPDPRPEPGPQTDTPATAAAPEQASKKAAAAPPAKAADKTAGKPPAAAPEKDKVGLTAWVVQLGSFSSEENARSLNDRLRKSGYAAFVEPLMQDGERVFRVRVGPELKRSEAQNLRERILAETKLEGIVVSYP